MICLQVYLPFPNILALTIYKVSLTGWFDHFFLLFVWRVDRNTNKLKKPFLINGLPLNIALTTFAIVINLFLKLWPRQWEKVHSLQVCWWHKTGMCVWYARESCSLRERGTSSRGTSTGWRNDLKGTSWSSTYGNDKTCLLEKNSHKHRARAAYRELLDRKRPGDPIGYEVGHEPAMWTCHKEGHHLSELY